MFHGRIPLKVPDLKKSVRPEKTSMSNSQITQDVIEQTKLIYQDVRKNAMQACIKYKGYYGKKTNASKLKEKDLVYVLKPKADHQGSKNPLTGFPWIGPYNVGKVLPNNYCLRKHGTNKTQMLHRIKLRQLTPRQPKPDVQATPLEWKPDPEVMKEHDEMYDETGECEYEKLIFDNDQDRPNIPTSPKMAKRFDPTNDEINNIPETI